MRLRLILTALKHASAADPMLGVSVSQLLPWLQTGGFAAFVLAVLHAILRGHLVPRKQVDAQVGGMQEVVVQWKDIATSNSQLVAEMLPLLRQTVDNDKVVIALVGALKETVDRLEPTPTRRDGERE